MTDKVKKIRAELERIMEACHDENGNPITYGEDCASARLWELKEYIDSLQEEPVGEELEKVSNKYSEDIESTYLNDMFDRGDIMGTFEAGANWQKEQFEKNRLKHCNSITKEQAELEQGFVDQHIEKYNRMPTFLDAIEYGMNLQKEQQKI